MKVQSVHVTQLITARSIIFMDQFSNKTNGSILTMDGLNGGSNCRLKTWAQLTFRKNGWV